jgi:hypothetical protein
VGPRFQEGTESQAATAISSVKRILKAGKTHPRNDPAFSKPKRKKATRKREWKLTASRNLWREEKLTIFMLKNALLQENIAMFGKRQRIALQQIFSSEETREIGSNGRNTKRVGDLWSTSRRQLHPEDGICKRRQAII